MIEDCSRELSYGTAGVRMQCICICIPNGRWEECHSHVSNGGGAISETGGPLSASWAA